MFRNALREVRHHPGRIVATVIAIAISIGFMATVSTFFATESNSWGRQMAAYAENADVSVVIQHPKDDLTAAKAEEVIKSVSGVEKVELLAKTMTIFTKDSHSTFAQTFTLPSEEFRWAKLAEGKWPTNFTEIALSKPAAEHLEVKVGDEISLESAKAKVKVVGITDEPKGFLSQPNAYIGAAPTDPNGHSPYARGAIFLIKLAQGEKTDAAVSSIDRALSPYMLPDGSSGKIDEKAMLVGDTKYIQDSAIESMLQATNVLKAFLMVFGVVALVVGTIIIANTFQVLVAQRRRQIGLLRAVGAYGSQVRKQFLYEAMLVGAIGGIVGIAIGMIISLVASIFTGSINYGFKVSLTDFGIEFLAAILITVIAALGPSLKATRVVPLEALRPADTVEDKKKVRWVRSIIFGLFLLAGVGLIFKAVTAKSDAENPLAFAVLGCLALTVAVLGLAIFIVPALLKLFGKLVGSTSATAKLAGLNAVRNPKRSTATAMALMLAVGLVVCLQVGTSTVKKTALSEIDRRYPVDMQITDIDVQENALTESVVRSIKETPNLAEVQTLNKVPVTLVDAGTKIHSKALVWNDDLDKVNPTLKKVPDDTVLLPGSPSDHQDSATRMVTLIGANGQVELKAKYSDLVDYNSVLISPSTAKKLGPSVGVGSVWIKLSDRSLLLDTVNLLQGKVDTTKTSLNGGAVMSYMIELMVNAILIVMTTLLGIAVLVALVGVASTLSLSVIERKHESAMLRSLGMQKRSLKLMMLIEALLISAVGLVIGFVCGGAFSWAMIIAGFKQVGLQNVTAKFAINPLVTVGLLVVVLLAAILASIGPGRRAASISPTQALSESAV